MADIINPENEEDLQAQIEEVEALSSIYGDEWCVIDEASRIFCIKISNDSDESKLTACLQIILPLDYPSASPPIYQINAAWLRGSERARLANSLEDLYVFFVVCVSFGDFNFTWKYSILDRDHAGESILYMWVEKIREFLVEKSQSSETVDLPGKVNMTTEEEEDDDDGNIPDFSTFRLSAEHAHLFMEHGNDEEIPPIKHGNTITDRRSTFQPHLAPVVAPRQILDVRNVMVVVSRWYGGILLGPDRFKHINNCARNILVEEGYTASTDEASKSGAKTKRPKNKKTK
ncbi:Protein IMPACT-B [Collichthys lucidus]|uniref:Protein IMPACT-B n=1 Tax=Collichthys lucidus TaxID=240159 RepID=A0A4U5UKL0_COLLU|nr:Protein IMPACT-B [Collichthys lucidus]